MGSLLTFALSGAGWRAWLAQAAIALALVLVSGCSGCDCDCGMGGCDFGPSGGCDIDLGSSSIGGVGSGGGPGCEPCGNECCVGVETCWQDRQCVVITDECDAPSDCEEGWICDFETAHHGLVGGEGGGAGGAPSCGPAATGLCVPMPPRCAESNVSGCLEACELDPAVDPPSLAARASWGLVPEDSVVGAIAALPFGDENCDGTIDEHDGAWVLSMTVGAQGEGLLRAHALEGDVLVERWAAAPVTSSPNDPASAIAAARVSLGTFVAVCTTDERVRSYRNGSELWLGPVSVRCDSLAIADVDGDSTLEVVSESQILNAATGTPDATYGPAPSHGFVVADVYPAGTLEIVTGSTIYDPDGNPLVESGLPAGFVGVGDLDRDGWADIVGVDPAQATLSVWRVDTSADVLRAAVDLHAALLDGCPVVGQPSGGPPVLADVTGDGVLDVGVATSRGYVVHDGDLLIEPTVTDTLVWASPALDCDGGTRGSTAFDFDGDGRAEVLAPSDVAVALYDAEGNALESFCNTAELGQAHPLVLDLDGDGFAELVSPASARGAGTCLLGQETAGLSVRSPLDAITRTRATHNELGYRVANVLPDGRVQSLLPGGAPLMRANAGDRTAPDLSIAWRSCDGPRVVVRNVGLLAVGARRARVDFYHEVQNELVGSVPLAVTLSPGASIEVVLGPGTTLHGPLRAEIVASGALGLELGLGECRVDNDVASHYCP